MKPTILNNVIEEASCLYIRGKGGVRQAGLAALVGMTIMGVLGCKNEEPQKEDSSPTESVEQIVQEPVSEDVVPRELDSLEKKLYEQTKIAFISSRDGNFEIYAMNADGSEQTNLTNYSDKDMAPCWSPDGKKIG